MPLEGFGRQRELVAVGGRLVELCAPFAMTVLAYDPYLTADEAMAKAEVLALRVLADRLERKEAKPQSISIGVAAA